MAAPLKISARVEIDAAPAKQGAAASVSAVDSIGTAAERNTTKLQALINASAGIGRGAANQSVREWTGALGMQGKSLEELRAKWNPLYATISQYKASLTEIRTLHAQNVLSTNEMTAAIQRQRQAALASIGAIKGRGLALREAAANANVVAGGTITGARGFETANIAAQFQDIAVTSAMGMSPLQIALQQGTQLSSVFATMDRPLLGIVTAFQSLLSPVSLVTIGLTAASAAALQYFTKADEEADKASHAIEAHGELIRRLREAYGEAAVGASEYAGESKKILQQDAADSARSYRSILTRTATDLIGGVTSLPVDDFEGATFIIQKMQGALAGLETSLAAGSPDIQVFVERLIEIENHSGASERIRELTEELRKAASEGLAAQRALGEISAFPARQRGYLLGSSTEAERLDYLDRQRLSLRQMQLDADARRAQLFARSPTELAEAARQTERARSITGESAGENRLRIELAGKTALIQAEKELADARRDRGRALDETLGQQQLELSLLGKTIGEQERLRMEYRLTTELKAEAERTGVAVDQAELARVQALSAEYGRLAEQMTARRALTDQDQEIAGLRARLALTGQSEEVRARVIVQLETERRLREMGINLGSREAEQYRKNAQAIAEATEELRKQEAAWSKVRGTAENSIDTMLDKFLDRDFTGAAKDIGKDWSKTILQLGVGNPLKNAALGTNHETLNDIGGLGGMLSRLFGGGMSTASMSVTAATVSINGGIGVGSLVGSAANDNTNPATAVSQALDLGSRAGSGSALSFVGNYKKGVDPRLTDILDTAAKQFPGFKVDAMSGFRPGDPRYHGKGMATDIQLTNLLSGKKLGNYQDASSFAAYERFAQTARAVQMEKYPELADKFRWGGYFGGGKGKYGALDTMHFDLAGAGMAGGSWAGGLTSAQKSLWPGIESRGNAAAAALAKVTEKSGIAAQGLGSLGTGMDKFGLALSGMNAGGGSGGGGAFGWLSSLFKPSAASLNASIGFSGANTTLGSFLTRGFRVGGPTGGSDPSRAAGIVHEKEFVFDEAATSRIGVANLEALRRGVLRGYREGGYVSVGQAYPTPAARGQDGGAGTFGGGFTQTIVNNSGQPIETRERDDGRGGRQQLVIIGGMVADAMSQPGNPAQRKMAQLGVKRPMVRR